MGTRKRRTSCGQPQAAAIFPAHSRAACSSATSTTAKPPRCSLVSMNGPSVNSGVPLDVSTLNTGAASSRPPVKIEDSGSLHLCHQRPDSLGLLAQLLVRVVGHPLVVEGDEVLGHVSSLPGWLLLPPSTLSTNGGDPIRHHVTIFRHPGPR